MKLRLIINAKVASKFFLKYLSGINDVHKFTVNDCLFSKLVDKQF